MCAHFRRYVAAAFFSTFSAPVFAQSGAQETVGLVPQFSGMLIEPCRVDSSDIRLDGSLDEVVWQVPSYGELHQVHPIEFAPSAERTDFWVCYSATDLYVAARMHVEDASSIVARQGIQGLKFESDDQLHISLDPFNQNRGGYFFQVNPRGVRAEASVAVRTSGFNAEWRTIWDAKSKINEDSWTTEIRVPFSSLSFNPENERWGFNIGRVIRRNGEVSSWSSLGKDIWEMGPQAMSDIGPIRDIERGKGIEFIVSGLANRSEDRTQEPVQSDTELEPSLDVFYKPSPKLTLGATFNTDFSATEVDDRIVNLSRFDVFLPEKRDFFLQDSARFQFADLKTNGQAFFSRRIGLDSNGEEIPIQAGLKASGEVGGLSFGSLMIRQDASVNQDEASNLFVARASQNLFNESSVGFIYTQGNPIGNEANSVSGIDFVYTNSNALFGGEIQGAAWLQQSDTEGLDGDDQAYGLGLAFPTAWLDMGWRFTEIQENFNPALGFVNRRDIRQHNLNVGIGRFYNSSWIQSYEPGLSYEQVNNTEGEKLSRLLVFTPLELSSQWGDSLSLSLERREEVLEQDFELLPGLSIASGEYEFDALKLEFGSAIARRLFVDANVENGEFYDGHIAKAGASIGLRPNDSILLNLGYELTSLDMPDEDRTTRLFNYSHQIALTEDWAWLARVQYDNVTRRAGVNSRLRWSPRAGRELYFVVNSTALRDLEDEFETEREDYTLKLSYTYRI